MIESSGMPEDICSLVEWAQALVRSMVGPQPMPGALAVDLTAGNGADTSFLYQLLGDEGRVVAFDIQREALDNCAARLEGQGATVTLFEGSEILSRQASGEGLPNGVTLICGDHAKWRAAVADTGAPCVIMANLGYLPGGDKSLVTTEQSTLKALADGFASLAAGAVVAVTCYVGHPGGEGEAHAVEQSFAALKPAQWRVLKLAVPNRGKAPYLLVAQKL